MLVAVLWIFNFPFFYAVEHEGSLDVHKILLMDDVRVQKNPVHNVSPYFTEINFGIILHHIMDCQVHTSLHLLD